MDQERLQSEWGSNQSGLWGMTLLWGFWIAQVSYCLLLRARKGQQMRVWVWH